MITVAAPVEVDHLVIGAGTSGCVVAGRLAAAGGRSVLVLEAGGSDSGLRSRVPAGTKWMFGRASHDWQHASQADPTLGGRAETWAAGRVVGGTSTINGMLYLRGAPADYDAWRDAGNPGWGHADLLPLFRRLERTDIGSEQTRGRSGPLAVAWTRTRHPLAQATADAMRAAGLPWTDDVNGAQFEGAAWAQVSQEHGVRANAARAFLQPALRGGPHPVRLVTRAQCLGLAIEGGRCVGARYLHRGQTHTVRARHGVVLCAGALRSPQLLMLSGIGPADALRALGLAVHAELPGVGQGLMDHPVAMLSARVDLPTYNVQTGLAGSIHHAWRYAVHRDGPLATPHAQLVAHVRSTPELLRPDVQIAFYPYAFERTANGVEPARTPAVMFSVTACQGRGQGEVTLASADALAAPRVYHRLLADPADVRTLTNGCRLVHRIAAQAPLAAHIREWIDIGPRAADAADADDDARWQRYLRDEAVLAYHPAGTCRMAELQRDPLGVVDARLRVHGIAGLRVADNSIMPAPVSSNIQAAAYVIGEKAAEMLLQDT
jgi:choline dehydrogenase